MSYENRLTVYLDVLGFENYINNTVETCIDPEQKINDVKRFLKLLKYLTSEGHTDTSQTKQITSFSDLIIISINSTEIDNFAFEILDIINVINNCILQGFLIRGAIVYGPLYHTKDQIFGPALNRSYKLERDIAKFPRVIIQESLVNDIVDHTKKLNDPIYLKFEEHVVYDEDGIYYIEYLKNIRDHTDNFIQYIDFLESLSKLLIKICENPILFQKFKWLNDRFIDLVESDKTLDWVFDKSILTKNDFEVFIFSLSEFRTEEFKSSL